jgi:putative transposase
MAKAPHRKRLRRYHEAGDVHEFTFSTFLRLPILTNDGWRTNLSRAIDKAGEECRVDLIAFVYMPEHVHLLVFPHGTKKDLSNYLAALKRPVAVAVKADLQKHNSPLMKKLTVQERPGKEVFRFWQEGAGYDRNLNTLASITAAIDYIHLNPVRRGLVSRMDAWRWSSARFYLSEGKTIDEALPRLTPLSAEYWQALG